MASDSKHLFSFFSAGGVNQVKFSSGADLANLDILDYKLWLALACPVKGVDLDSKTLLLIDSNNDGRIRAPELIAAVKWTANLLKTPQIILDAPESLALDNINDEIDEGKSISNAAKKILQSLGKDSESAITAEDMLSATEAFNKQPFNGDGVITENSADNDADKQLIREIIECVGAVDDRSSAPGVNDDKITEFFKNISDYLTWLNKGKSDPSIVSIIEKTKDAFEKFLTVRSKIDDYFARCRLAAYDQRAAVALNRDENAYIAVAAKDLVITDDEIKVLPLAQVAADRPLPLVKGINPAWETAMSDFVAFVVQPLIGKKEFLNQSEWEAIKRQLTPYESWQAEKAGVSIEKLGIERIEILSKDGARKTLDGLLEKEQAQEESARTIASVEKLVLYCKNLCRLINNFVSFRDFYQQKQSAIFQAGDLFLDRRQCKLCIRIEDIAKHSATAHFSHLNLAYCECSRLSTGEKMNIAAAFTAGESDGLTVGRNGVFVDNEGKDWDATIVKVIENPISVRQAAWSPYKKLLRFIEEQVAKRASASEAKSGDMLTKGAESTAAVAETGKPASAPPKKLDIGIVAAIGVAVGGITAAFGALLQAFFGLGFYMPLGILGILLIISGPSMLIAWMKLRQRNLGPILDANGWAINSRALLNIPLGASLTLTAKIPKGSKLDRNDMFEQKKRPWKLYFITAVIIALGAAWYMGKLDSYLPSYIQSTVIQK